MVTSAFSQVRALLQSQRHRYVCHSPCQHRAHLLIIDCPSLPKTVVINGREVMTINYTVPIELNGYIAFWQDDA